jgi:hypothetical protein
MIRSSCLQHSPTTGLILCWQQVLAATCPIPGDLKSSALAFAAHGILGVGHKLNCGAAISNPRSGEKWWYSSNHGPIPDAECIFPENTTDCKRIEGFGHFLGAFFFPLPNICRGMGEGMSQYSIPYPFFGGMNIHH